MPLGLIATAVFERSLSAQKGLRETASKQFVCRRSQAVYNLSLIHIFIRLLQFVAGDILYVQVDSYHAVMEVEGLVHTQV